MPQLNPAPWFLTLLTTWLIMLLLLKPTLTLMTPMKPPTMLRQSCTTRHWDWTWY
uniref:ATP synthase complex subunit 8 n=1 Tax=Hemidactylus frenatus TaxID=47729 RepID=F1LKY1_HEMFR|nr:ATP synthase F0 subunit 8 [Hemidactylus frenatus]ACS37287.1 ATP synthase F0 subunit 8 [Hemidactylus frenatus]